jgi:hypothetical protein
VLGKGARAGEPRNCGRCGRDARSMVLGRFGPGSGGLVGPWPLLNTFCHFLMFYWDGGKGTCGKGGEEAEWRRLRGVGQGMKVQMCVAAMTKVMSR